MLLTVAILCALFIAGVVTGLVMWRWQLAALQAELSDARAAGREGLEAIGRVKAIEAILERRDREMRSAAVLQGQTLARLNEQENAAHAARGALHHSAMEMANQKRTYDGLLEENFDDYCNLTYGRTAVPVRPPGQILASLLAHQSRWLDALRPVLLTPARAEAFLDGTEPMTDPLAHACAQLTDTHPGYWTLRERMYVEYRSRVAVAKALVFREKMPASRRSKEQPPEVTDALVSEGPLSAQTTALASDAPECEVSGWPSGRALALEDETWPGQQQEDRSSDTVRIKLDDVAVISTHRAGLRHIGSGHVEPPPDASA
jgi:hypothetical protein